MCLRPQSFIFSIRKKFMQLIKGFRLSATETKSRLSVHLRRAHNFDVPLGIMSDLLKTKATYSDINKFNLFHKFLTVAINIFRLYIVL